MTFKLEVNPRNGKRYTSKWSRSISYLLSYEYVTRTRKKKKGQVIVEHVDHKITVPAVPAKRDYSSDPDEYSFSVEDRDPFVVDNKGTSDNSPSPNKK